MADFNKIFVDSSISVANKPLSILCFNDGSIISKNRYALENGMLSIFDDTKSSISIFYQNSLEISRTRIYEFTRVLNKDQTTIANLDDINSSVTDLVKENILVFLDGELEPTDNYTVLENGNGLILNTRSDINLNKEHKIIVYSSKIPFQRISNPKFVSENNKYLIENAYDLNNTLIFLNNKKVDFNNIEYNPEYSILDSITKKNRLAKVITLQVPETYDEISSIEIIRLNDTQSLNFKTDQGYLMYGPYDDFYKKIPNFHDIVFTFNDQVKILIDDIRKGFIIKEVDGFGEAIVTDIDFETTQLHAITLQQFKLPFYQKNEYYFEVPHYTNIIKYLAEYDNKFTFIPEILRIFQRLLLDEINDTIERLRNSRSIHKIDSTQVNNLLKLLGLDLNTKVLTKKQRKELIEELNEFYRIVGTRDSYNLLNILQNDLKLINIEQLFTPYGITESEDKKILWNYYPTITNENEGTGYKQGDYLRAITTIGKTPIDVIAEDVQNGKIKSVRLLTPSDYEQITEDDLPLNPALQGKLDVTSKGIDYAYSHTIRSTVSEANKYHVGDVLKTNDNKFTITVTAVNSNGQITDSTLTPDYGTEAINDSNISINDVSGSVTVGIISTQKDTKILVTSLKYSDLTNGEFSLTLPQGSYYFEMSGGGGSGGSGDSDLGIRGDINSTAGYDGELIKQKFSLSNTTVISGKLGQGGGSTRATSGAYTDSAGGKGYDSGKIGNGATGTLYQTQTTHVSLPNKGTTSRQSSVRIYNTGTSNAKYNWALKAGNGGGSSYIKINNNVTYIAKGGNGGNAGGDDPTSNYYAYTNQRAYPLVTGGQGGNGGVNGGGGASGGNSAYEDPNGDFQSGKGEDGYINIYRYELDYSGTISGNTAQLSDGQTISNIIVGNKVFTGTISKTSTTTKITLSPASGYEYINGNTRLDIGKSAILSITSSSTAYQYNCKLYGIDYKYLKNGDVFYNTEGTPFTITIKNVDKANKTYEISYSPTAGTDNINMTGVDAYYKTGKNAKLSIRSVESTTQNLADRCYIDFYTREELGAEYQKEYRISYLDYGIITEGTPKSPKWWIGGEPDIEYGTISEGKTDDIDYGYITDKIEGEWFGWWKWDRKGIWYPTNHVIAEVKLPIDVKFTEFIDTFVEQFYGIASTVIYLHGIIESFYFGEDTSNDNSGSTTDNTNKQLGIATGAPIMDYEITVTSNPHIQYKEHEFDECTLTIIPTPSNAKVTITSGDDTITVYGTCSLTVGKNEYVEWKVEKTGYKSRSEKRLMTKDATKRVVLEAEYVPTINYYTLTVVPTPSDATVTFDIGEVHGNSVTVPEDTEITYTVSKNGYVTKTGSKVVTKNETIYVSLSEIQYYTLTIIPTPSNANVTLSASGYNTIFGAGQQSITVRENTPVTYTVNAMNYVTVSANITLNETKTLNVILKNGLDLSNYEYTITPTNNVTLTEYIGTSTEIVTPHL